MTKAVVNGDIDSVVSEGRSKVLGLLANSYFQELRFYYFGRVVGRGRQTDPLPWAPKDLATALITTSPMHCLLLA